jgi:hypothetical protein
MTTILDVIAAQTVKTRVGTLTNLANWREWFFIDTQYRQGEYGILEFRLNSLPSWVGSTIASLATAIDGLLESRGVNTWRKTQYNAAANIVEVYFVTGLAPLAIIGIILAGAVLTWVLVNQITAYKVSSTAANTDALIKQQTADAVLNTIDQLPLEQQLPALQEVAKQQAESDIFPTASSPAQTQTTNRWIIVAIAGVAAVVLGIFAWRR